MDGEYRNNIYSINELFSKLGQDYETFTIEKTERKKSTGRTKKEETEQIEETETISINDVDVEKLYNIDMRKIPQGIYNMLKGFQRGYANLQVMSLTLYFKNRGCTCEEIIDILKTTEKINGNDWNEWNIEDEVKRIYNNYDYLSKFIRDELENEFGSFEMGFCVPVGIYNPKHLKIYIFLLMNGSCKKKDIINGLGISNNTVDSIMKNNNLIKLENRIYSINETEFDNFLMIDKKELEKLNSLDYKELGIYTYLKWRTGLKKSVKVSILTMSEKIGIATHTISETIKSLEKRGLIKVKRFKYKKHESGEFYKEINEYTIS